ncbi:hypothetical protein BDBG_18120 [Blastomyces gilchristii SLH14081]|uniref:Uncharacterized protein n=1 Tax=Blastomyces gilchristii (strain SLH14081) TaxID=559298 RepID=A0A179V5G0_BLAGS|nr:uncharacterized protein BDBG_18120 [Blastomyces gilchristii SLH14081]OAT14601.1 hypothetical protein BDBG_18120 [Blastomyces gilchristii SLH14081]
MALNDTVLTQVVWSKFIFGRGVFQGVRGGPNQKLHKEMDLCRWHLEFRPLHGQVGGESGHQDGRTRTWNVGLIYNEVL